MSSFQLKTSKVDTQFMAAIQERYPEMSPERLNAIRNTLDQARPGDVLATHFGDTKLSWKDWLGIRGVEQFTGTPQHLAMFVDDKGTVVGASEKGGVREVPAYREMSRANDVGVSILRPKNPLTQTQMMKAVGAARAQIGTPFGGDHMTRLVGTSWMPKGLANKFSPDICDGPACSTLVANSYEQAGRGLKGLNPHAATPSDFLANDFKVIAKSGDRAISRPFFGRAASPLAKAFKYGVVPAGLATTIYAMNRPTPPAQKTSSIQKSSAATFLSSLANAARPGQTLRQAILQNAGIATTAGSVFSPLVYGAAEAAGGGLEAHAISQLANFGTAGAQAGAGTLLGHFGKNTAFVKRLLERANRAKKVQPPAGGIPGVEEAVRQKQSDVSTELRPHQERILRRILSEDQPGLVVAHGLGSGKTLSSIAAAEALGGDTLVALPSSLRANFQKELDKHLTDPVRSSYLLDSIQRIGRNEEMPEADNLIIDEAHRLRNPTSKTRQFVRKKAQDYAKRLLLTATPVYNKPSDIAGPINIAAAESVLPASPTDFNRKYVGEELVKPGWFAKTFKGVQPGIREKIINEGELRDIFSKWVDFQRNSTEGFPERIDETINVPMTDRQLEVYNYMLNDGPAWLKHKIRKGLPPSKQESKSLNTFLTGTRHVSTTPHSYVDGMTEDDAIENAPKIRAAFDRLKERLTDNADHRAVVYANFLDGLGHYQKLLKDEGIPYGVFTGNEKKRDRDQAIRDYNEGKLKALFVSSAGGEGLDLKGTRQIQVLEPHFNEEKLEQVIGRGIRYGSHAHLPEDQRNVLVEKYLATLPERKGLMRMLRGKNVGGSVDQYLAQLAAEKKRVADQLTGLMEEATEMHKTSSTLRVRTSFTPSQEEALKAFLTRTKTSFQLPKPQLPEMNVDNVLTGVGALAGAALFARGGHRLGSHLRRARMTRALEKYPGISNSSEAFSQFSTDMGSLRRASNRATGPVPLSIGGGLAGGAATGFGLAQVDADAKASIIRAMAEINELIPSGPPPLSEKDVEDRLLDARDGAANRDEDFVDAMSELDSDLHSTDLSDEEQRQIDREAEQEVEDLLLGFGDFDRRLKESSLGSFGASIVAGLRKESARAGVRQLRALYDSGNQLGFTALARKLDKAGALKRTPLGTQIAHLGSGKEGLATLTVGASSAPVGHASVRKVYDPDSPMMSPEGIQGLMSVRRRAKKNPELVPGVRFAKPYSSRIERSPQGLRYLHNEYVPNAVGAMPSMRGPVNPAYDPFIVGDLRADNIRRTIGGQAVITDFLSVPRKQFAGYHANVSGDWVSPQSLQRKSIDRFQEANKIFLRPNVSRADAVIGDRKFGEALLMEGQAQRAQDVSEQMIRQVGDRFNVNENSLLRRLGPQRRRTA